MKVSHSLCMALKCTPRNVKKWKNRSVDRDFQSGLHPGIHGLDQE